MNVKWVARLGGACSPPTYSFTPTRPDAARLLETWRLPEEDEDEDHDVDEDDDDASDC